MQKHGLTLEESILASFINEKQAKPRMKSKTSSLKHNLNFLIYMYLNFEFEKKL